MPFITWFAAGLRRIMRDKVYKEVPHLKYIDVRMLDAPAIGIEQSKKEVVQIGDNVRKMLNRLKVLITAEAKDERSENKIFHLEEVLDIVQKEVTEYLSILLSGNVPHEIVNTGRIQLRMADEYESISDYIAAILKLKIKLRKSGAQMSQETTEEIMELHNRVSDYIVFINEGVKEENYDIISKANIRGESITHYIRECRSRHLQRVGTERTSPLKSLIITDLLNSYRRIKDHGFNIAEALAGKK
jgi:phosphate:Na+ symporter